MPDVNAVYQSEFLRASQLQGQARRVQIEAATVEVLGQGDKAAQKIVLKFPKIKQRLPLNKTNAQLLASTWGPQTDSWIGKYIELRPEKVMFSGSMVDSIRVRPATALQAVPAKEAAPASAQGGIADLEDDLPF